MMAKITTGSSFGGALDYDRDKNQQNQKIATFLDSCGVDMNYKPDGMPDPDMKAVVRSFEIQAVLNPKVSKPVVHIALTFKPEDKPRLTNAYMVKLAKEYMQEMGFTNTQYVIHRHEETRNPHVHITINRVDTEGKRISDSNELRRTAAVCKAITLREGLSWGDSKVISQAKVNDKAERFRYDIAKTVYQCLQKSSTLTQFQQETAKHGIETTLKLSESSGKVIGITFTAKDSEGKEHVFKGSKLARELSAGSILKTLGQERMLNDLSTGKADAGSKFFPAGDVKESAPERSSASVQDVALTAGEMLLGGIFSGGGSKREEDEEIGKKKDRGISY